MWVVVLAVGGSVCLETSATQLVRSVPHNDIKL